MEDYFIEMRDLRFEDYEEGGEMTAIRQLIAPWIPTGKGVIARFHNRHTGRDRFDYITITEDMIYFALLVQSISQPEPHLRSIKCFKSTEMAGFAFVLEALTREEEADVPNIRLMLHNGTKFRLVFDDADEVNVLRRMQEISTKNFFLD